MRIVVYELNELPWRVLDAHVRRRPHGAFARLIGDGACYTTVAHPDDALHPWVTWPTMHRGVPSSTLGVRFIGQDPTTFQGTPLWEAVRRHGRSAGVFGSMGCGQPEAPSPTDFHVPDCFAESARCAPADLEPFQRLLLANVRRSGRSVGAASGPALLDAFALSRLGVRPRTAAGAAWQLASERWEPRLAYRRPSLAGRLGFDLFHTRWRRQRPDYAAFFTTDLAWRMHRYWRAAFPGDLPGIPGDDRFYAHAVADAMDHAEAHLGALLDAADDDPGLIVAVAASMGQAAVPAGHEPGALQLVDVAGLMRTLGCHGPWTQAFAMDPDVTVRFDTVKSAEAFGDRAVGILDRDGAPVLGLDRVGADVSVHVHQNGAALRFRDAVVDGNLVQLASLGVAWTPTETPGTGHHTRHGVLAFAGSPIRRHGDRAEVCATRYAPTVLTALGLPVHTVGEPIDCLR